MIEAPAEEPRDLRRRDGVAVEGVSRTFVFRRRSVTALERMSLRTTPLVVSALGPLEPSPG